MAEHEIPEVDHLEKEVVLVIGDVSFKCQRRILAENSPYFNAMFNSGMMESTAEVIELKGNRPQAIEMIIRSLKTGEFNCPFEFIPALLEASSMYQFANIREQCIAILLCNLNINNCLGIMFLASKFVIDDLLRESRQYALWDAEAVLRGSEFLELPVQRVVEYLSVDELNVSSEDLVLNGVLNWMKYDKNVRIKHYEDLFSAVRFSYIDLKSLKTIAHDPFVLKHRKMRLLVHEIWKIKFMKVVQSSTSPLSVSPLSSVSPTEEEFPGAPSQNHGDSSDAESTSPMQVVPEICVEEIIAHRLLSAGPRSIPMVPALAFCNTKDKSESPILVYYDEKKRKPVKICSLKKAFHSCGNAVSVANGFKVCAIGNSICVIGGEFMLGHGNWLTSVWKCNTFFKSWSFVTNLRDPRRHHELCIMDGGIYLIGGIGRFRVAQDTVQRLDILSGNVTDIMPMLVPVTSAAVVAHQGKLYIFELLVYRYNAESNAWNCLKSIRLPPHGFHSAMTHANGIYLVGRWSTQLSLYCPECQAEPFHKASFKAVGNFNFNTENACIVGNKIYSFSKMEYLIIESYDIEANVFTIEYMNEDGSFLGPQYLHGCFALPRYT